MKTIKILFLLVLVGLSISSMGFGTQEIIQSWHKEHPDDYSPHDYSPHTLEKLRQYLPEVCSDANEGVEKQAEEMDKISITVEWAGGGKIIIRSLGLDRNATVADLKQKVATRTGITASEVSEVLLFLGHGGKELTGNTQTVEGAGIVSDSTIVCLPYLLEYYKKNQKIFMVKLCRLSPQPEISGFNFDNSLVSEWPGVRPELSGVRGGADEKGHITKINLSFKQLTGSIPSGIDALRKLRRLNLCCTHQLTGSIPSKIGKLTALTYLNLCTNKLTGPIPTEIGNLAALMELTLSLNKLTGSIPSEIGNLIKLTGLHLDHNQLEGEIPTEIGNLIKLINLRLQDNELTDVDAFKDFMKDKVPDDYMVL